MHKFIPTLAYSAILTAALAPAAAGAQESCTVTYHLTAPFADAGFQKTVHLESTCPVTVRCEISTDDGLATTVEVPPRQRLGVVVEPGADDPGFDATATCEPL